MTEMLGPYELRGELGRGAMAVVWRAWDSKLDREVALKEPTTAGMPGVDAAEFAERFVREGRAGARLNHPNIVAVYSADVYDGRAALVMELVEGPTLSKVATGPLPVEFVASVLDQLLYAVAYAHSRGIVHRDIKPDNVFVTGEGQVKLADFGIARTGNAATLTRMGTTLGTPGYMSPEQVRGNPADARSDLFSVGVMGYEMLAGYNPFGASSGTDPTSVMYQIAHEDAPPIEQVAPGVPPGLATAIRVAMARDPSARFQSANDMRAALLSQPAVAPAPEPTPAAYSAATVMSQPDATVMSTTAAGPQPAGTLPGTAAAPAAEAPAPRRRVGLIVLAIVGALISAIVLCGVGWFVWGVAAVYDTTIPTAMVLTPKEGDTIPADKPLTIKAIASDNKAVTKVTLLLDGKVVAVLDKPPYETSIKDPIGGTHVVTAVAQDAMENTGTSTAVSVKVVYPPEIAAGAFWSLVGKKDWGAAWVSLSPGAQNRLYSDSYSDFVASYTEGWKGLTMVSSDVKPKSENGDKATVVFDLSWTKAGDPTVLKGGGTTSLVKGADGQWQVEDYEWR